MLRTVDPDQFIAVADRCQSLAERCGARLCAKGGSDANSTVAGLTALTAGEAGT
jgi:hypothetical protein